MQASIALVLVGLGLATSAFADGRLEEVRNRFNTLQKSYDDTKKNLDKGATDDGKASAKELNENVNKVCNFTQDIWDRVDGIPALKAIWKDVKYWCTELAIRSSELSGIIGKGDHIGYLSKVTESFLKLGDSLKVGYDTFKDFGQKWQIICDTCR